MSSGGTTVVQPTPPPAPTVGESAKEFAQALPDILAAQLRFQPQFDQATFDSFERLGPEFARVSRDVLNEFSPNLASLDEELSKQALELSQSGLSESARDLFRDEFKALAGNQVNSGLGASFVAKNLVQQNEAAKQSGRNLGLAIQGKVPVAQAFQQPSQFQVANSFGPAFATDAGTFGSVFSGAGRPLTTQNSNNLGGAGGIFQGLGGLAKGVGAAGAATSFFCWVAKEVFGSWEHPKTHLARYFIGNIGPKWFKDFYIKHGEGIAEYIKDKPILKNIIKPLFEVFAYIAKVKLLGGSHIYMTRRST